MHRRIARETLRLLESHQPFVRATVVHAVGSVPGKVGSTMILRADRSSLGTVGGAALEERVKELGRAALDTHASTLHHFDLRKWAPGGLPSLCGGSVDIAVEYIAARPNLLLWGGGHVAQALTRLLPELEYDYSVADDRADWVTPERFPSADRRMVVDPVRVWQEFDPATFTHLYVLGYDAERDLDVLRQSISEFPGFIGLIASASKKARMFQSLRERGVPASALDRIHVPVGLSIRAESPAEIAVSIVAEIIASQHPPPTKRLPKVEPVAEVRGGVDVRAGL